jgi:hypothetical protein
MKWSLEKLDIPRKASEETFSGCIGCVFVSKSVKVETRPAPQGLPKNWLNPRWVRNLTDIEAEMLEPAPERPIPECVHITLCCLVNSGSCDPQYKGANQEWKREDLDSC